MEEGVVVTRLCPFGEARPTDVQLRGNSFLVSRQPSHCGRRCAIFAEDHLASAPALEFRRWRDVAESLFLGVEIIKLSEARGGGLSRNQTVSLRRSAPH